MPSSTLCSPKLKILLTGASGFIGSNFVQKLHKKYDIVALVRKQSDINAIKNFCKIYVYDESKESLELLFSQYTFDGIIHLATLWLNRNQIDDAPKLIESNIGFGVLLLEYTKKHNISFFINTATFGSYCNSLSYRPSSLYAATKKAFEDIMFYYSLTCKQSVFTNLLLFNVYGNGDKGNRLFALLEKIAQSGEELAMSDGNQITDYSYIDDVIAGFENLIELTITNPSFCKDKIFALRGTQRKPLKEVVKLFEKTLGKKLHIKWGARANRELEIMTPWEGGELLPNWKQKFSLKEGFKNMLASNGGGGHTRSNHKSRI